MTSEAGLGIVEVLWEPPRSYFVWLLGILALLSMLSALISLTCSTQLEHATDQSGGETKLLSLVRHFGGAS